MIDVQDLLATLPSKITCLSVGHFGVSSKDSVMQGLNALYQRRENISLKHFKLHVRCARWSVSKLVADLAPQT